MDELKNGEKDYANPKKLKKLLGESNSLFSGAKAADVKDLFFNLIDAFLTELNKDNHRSNAESYSSKINSFDKKKIFEETSKEIEQNKPFQLENNETLFPIIFVTMDSKFHYSLICKDTEIFSQVEYRLYKKYPEYIESENYFTVNGIKVNRFKSLKDNSIRYSDIVIMIPGDN